MTDSQPTEKAPQYGIGPFSLREVILLGVWLVAFLVSFFPFGGFGSANIWTAGLDWILAIGVPTVAAGLIALRRFSPEAIRRVGSLGVDQFASVAFSVAAVVWLAIVWSGIATTLYFGGAPGPWVAWVELILMLGGVALTVFAPLIPTIQDDFAERPEIPAQPAASPVKPVVQRPAGERAPKPAREPKAPKPARQPKQQPDSAPPPWEQADAAVFGQLANAAPAPDAQETQAYTPLDAETEAAQPQPQPQPQPAAQTRPEPQQPQPQPQPQQAFWALAPVERDVVDQNGTPLFRIGPTAWALVIEDRGSAYVVRAEDGRTGFLTDVSGVLRG